MRVRALFTGLGIVVVLTAGICPALAQTDNWLGGAGNWSNAGMWSAGEPTSTSNVFIDAGNPKASPVTLDIQTQCNTLTIDSDDSLSFDNGTLLQINGSTISNAGAISLNSAGSPTYIFIANGATLSGGGTVTMGNSSQNQIDGTSGVVLTNQSTIQGAGLIGPHFLIANQGTVSANITGATMSLEQESSGTDTNTATIEATNGGTLLIQVGGPSAFNNTGGTIKAVGSNSQVQLAVSSLTGGTLTTSSGGTIVQPAGSSSTLNTLTNSGTYSILNNGTVSISGTITNTGNIQLNSGGSLTELFVPSAATLTGAGTITLSNNSQNEVDGNSGATLTNKQTIQGVGNIGPHFLFANQGTINANVKGATLNVIQQTSGTDTNTATMEATNGGIMAFQTGGSSSINNTGGTIEAIGTGSQVQFENGTTIDNGTLTTSTNGLLSVNPSASLNLSGVTNNGVLTAQNNATIELQSSITNNGTINISSGGSLTELFLPSASVSLLGKGKVVLNNNPNSAIDGIGGVTLTNHNTIQGSGMIGPHFDFTNSGTINVPKGDTININAPAFTNFTGSTVVGGTYLVTGTLMFTNASITNNSANITLSGASAQIVNQSSVNALTGLYMNNKGAHFTVTSGNVFTTPGNPSGVFTNAGTLKVGAGGTFKVSPTPPTLGDYTQSGGATTVDGTLNVPGVTISAGSLLGKGSLTGSVTSSGSVTPGDSATKPGILSPNTYTQKSTGSLNIDIGGSTVGTEYGQLAVTNGASLNGTLNIKVVNGFVPTIGTTFTILTASAVSGTFATVNGLSINSGEHFDPPVYNASSVTLTVASGP